MTRRFGWVVAVFVVLAVAPAAASAASVPLCVPSGPDAAVTTPLTGGACPSGKTKQTLASNADLAAAKTRIADLEALLAGVSRSSSSGVTTLKFSGMNVQVVSGSGKTDGTVNGEGNLIIGYDETRSGVKRTGSHNLIVGKGQSFSSWGSVLAGERNTSSSHGGLLGGVDNAAVDNDASVTGGQHNRAGKAASSVTGGAYNVAGVQWGSVTGGGCNSAGPVDPTHSNWCNFPSGDEFATVTGGILNHADSAFGSITGGGLNTTTLGSNGSITGGQYNETEGDYASVTGGAHNLASAHWGTVSGGGCGLAGDGAPRGTADCALPTSRSTAFAVASGGIANQANGFGAVASAGADNWATGPFSSVSGGSSGTAIGKASSILGSHDVTVDADYGTYPTGP